MLWQRDLEFSIEIPLPGQQLLTREGKTMNEALKVLDFVGPSTLLEKLHIQVYEVNTR